MLASHLGRPKGEVRDELRLAPVGAALAALLGRPVHVVVGVSRPPRCRMTTSCCWRTFGSIRARKRTTSRSPGASRELADAYVDDAFGAVHRAHASVSALPELSSRPAVPPSPAGSGQKEVEVLGRLLAEPDRPFVAILGGAKISDKLAVIELARRSGSTRS